MTPQLETRRLILRLPAPSDAEAVVRYLNNFAVAGNLARVPYPYSRTDADAWLGQHPPGRPPEETQFAIELKGVGYIGQVGFHTDVIGPVIGYWLGEPFWHRGIMTEAAGAALDWYFGASAAEFIRSGVFAFNRASLAVQKKLGFTVTGASTRHCLARNEELRHIDTELSRAGWVERRARVPEGWPPGAPAERATNGVKP
jgi:RimJ/RimL family protein N-acetyltransferase